MKSLNNTSYILFTCIVVLLVTKTNAQEPFWAKSVSSTDYEYGVASDIDSQGNLFIIGYGTGPTLGINGTTYNANGDGDAFIAKFSPTHQLLWFKPLGGDDNVYFDYGMDVHVDDNDDVIILVTSAGNNFTYDGQILSGINSSGQYSGEGVIIKIDNNGNYLWHDSGSVSSSFQNVSTDASGNVYLTGWFYHTITLGDSITMTNTTIGTTDDMFIAKYQSNGHLLWAHHAGGTTSNSFAYGQNIALDRSSGKVFIVGRYESTIYFATATLATLQSSSTFLIAYDTGGTELWVESLFSNGYSFSQGLDISSNGLIGVAGYNTFGSGPDGLVGFYDLNGNVQSEVTYPSNYCRLHSLAFNQMNECFITGTFQDTVVLGTAPDTVMLTASLAGFVLKLDSNHVLDWAKQISSSYENEVTCKNYRILYAGRIDSPFMYNYGADSIVNITGDALFAEFYDEPCAVSDITTSATDTSVMANNTTATYQWLDCNNNYAAIEGATSQTFVPSANGSYAVQLTENSCVDTSACVDITHIGIIENDFGNKFSVYPNPTMGDVTVDLGKNFQNILVTLTDMNGKIIQSETYDDKQMVQLKVGAAAGVYLMKVEAGNRKATVRVMKK
jgi:hypothetical protein